MKQIAGYWERLNMDTKQKEVVGLKIINSIKWFAIWLSMAVLKRTLLKRLKMAGKECLQPVVSNKPELFNRVDYILDHCNGKNVLHIGFTDHPFTKQRIEDGSLLHLQLQKVTSTLVGMDIEETAIQEYISMTDDVRVFNGDITVGYPDQFIKCKPELILLSEVLEHLTDPYRAIDILYQRFPEGTSVLVTVPNYTALDSFAASLNQTESVHPDHKYYFSPYTLRRLLDDKRFELKQLDFGMYYQPKSRINLFLKNYPFNGDCIIALFIIIKN